MNTRIDIIDGIEVVITICPSVKLPKKLTAKGKPTYNSRRKKLKKIAEYRAKNRNKVRKTPQN